MQACTARQAGRCPDIFEMAVREELTRTTMHPKEHYGRRSGIPGCLFLSPRQLH